MPDSSPESDSSPAKSRVRPILLVAIVAIIVAQVVALNPSALEQPFTQTPIPPEKLLESPNQVTIAPGIPIKKVPEYSVDGFNYVSTHNSEKQWKLVAKKAYLYNTEKLVHSREIVAYLYDSEGQITVVTGREGKYFMNQRDLEVFGDVHARFPDGFETVSEYLHYQPAKHHVNIPISYSVQGKGTESKDSQIDFESDGLEFDMEKAQIFLPKAVRFTMTKIGGPVTSPTPSTSPLPNSTPMAPTLQTQNPLPTPSPTGTTAQGDVVPDTTTIESDRCLIDRKIQLAQFTMDPHRKSANRFVRITQPGFFAKGRRTNLHYGDFAKLLQYMVAYEDVLIRETGDSQLKYGTGGIAEFDAHRNVIVLKQFPQVYQNDDTVTGDVIVVHRDTDIVEVEHSNAFSQGDSSAGPVPNPRASFVH